MGSYHGQEVNDPGNEYHYGRNLENDFLSSSSISPNSALNHFGPQSGTNPNNFGISNPNHWHERDSTNYRFIEDESGGFTGNDFGFDYGAQVNTLGSSPPASGMLLPNTPIPQYDPHSLLNSNLYDYNQQANLGDSEYSANPAFGMNSSGSNLPQLYQAGTHSDPNQYQHYLGDLEHAGEFAQTGNDGRYGEGLSTTAPHDIIQGAAPSMRGSQGNMGNDPFQTPIGSRNSSNLFNTKSSVVKNTGNSSEDEVEDESDEDGDYVEDSSPDSMEVKQEGSRRNTSKSSDSQSKAISAAIKNIGASSDPEGDLLRIEKMMREQKQKGEGDSSFPKDLRTQSKCVEKLFDAFYNIEDVVDKQSIHGKPSQAVKRFTKTAEKLPYYPEDSVKLKCWEFLFLCRDSQNGIRLVPKYHRSKIDQYPTFGARWDQLIVACKSNKALCKQIMDASYTARVAEAPLSETKMKANNRSINAKRDEQNSVGRRVIKSGLTPSFVEHLQDSPTKKSTGTKKTPKKRATLTNAFYTPTTSGTPTPLKSSNGKRKYNTLLDHEGEDLDSQETPTKKGRIGRSKAGTKAPSFGSRGENENSPSGEKFYHSQAPQVSPQGNEKEYQYHGANGAATSIQSLQVPFGAAINSGEERVLESQYKKEICDLLSVDYGSFKSLTLHQLRVYARAYNDEMQKVNWTHPDAPGYVWKGFSGVHAQNGHNIPHFALLLHEFKALSEARGDLFDHSLSTEVKIFKTDESKHIHTVLGMIPGPLGGLRTDSQ